MPSPRQTDVMSPWQRYGWLMSVVWLGFLFYPAAALSSSSAPSWLVAIGWGGTAVFGVAYLAGFVVGTRNGQGRKTPAAAWILLLVALASATLTLPAIGWDALSFVPFMVAYVSYVIGGIWHWVAAGVGMALVGAAMVTGAISSWMLLVVLALMTVVNTINIWLIGRSVADSMMREALIASEEREAVARDVHDLLGHSLTVVKLKAELALRLLDRDPAAVRSELTEIIQLSGEAMQGVRRTVTELRAGGLAEQLERSTAALTSGGVLVTVSGDPAALSQAQAIPAGWILREATTNVLRHAKARRVSIVFEPGTLIVADDGIGGSDASGHGIRGMTERAAAAGAKLVVGAATGTAAATGTGTKVSLTW